MSFNYLEIARAADLVSAELKRNGPVRVQSVELVEFQLPSQLPDLNVGIRLDNKKTLVLSLKAPWLGVLWLSSGLFRQAKQGWVSAFGKVAEWPVAGKTLLAVRALEKDRVLEFEFSDGVRVTVHLFPSRPNWVLQVGEAPAQSWKPMRENAAAQGLGVSKITGPSSVLAGRAVAPLALRDFAADGVEIAPNSDPTDWFFRANQYYLEQRQIFLLQRLAQSGLAQVQGKLTRLIKIRGQMHESLTESAKADDVLARGERLKSILHEYPKTFRAKQLDGIELDSKLSLADNVTRYFTRYKKLKRTKQEVELRLAGVEAQAKKTTSAVAKLRGLERGIASRGLAGFVAPGEPAPKFENAFKRLQEIFVEAELELPGVSPREKKLRKEERKWEKAGLRNFRSKEGLAIWVGRNHAENEELVIRMARGNDMWLHLKGRPGAHVVIQLPGGKSPSLETLLDAANIVAYYSNITPNDKVEVDYTFRKFVKRVSGIGSEKFLVTYSQNKTLMVRLEEARVKRLIAGGEGAL